jgi:hypothetical protein
VTAGGHLDPSPAGRGSVPTVTEFRPPRGCPVCSGRLDITQLGCGQCGTGLTGRFEQCDYCGLDDAQRDILRIFLTSRGNMKDLERHLGVSYPTARARYDDILKALGLAPTDSATGASEPTPSPEAPDRLGVLQALARGEVDVATAKAALE